MLLMAKVPTIGAIDCSLISIKRWEILVVPSAQEILMLNRQLPGCGKSISVTYNPRFISGQSLNFASVVWLRLRLPNKACEVTVTCGTITFPRREISTKPTRCLPTDRSVVARIACIESVVIEFGALLVLANCFWLMLFVARFESTEVFWVSRFFSVHATRNKTQINSKVLITLG